MLANRNILRRNILRGMVGGSAVTVALPFLDCFLNANGTALASGQALPVRFGTWTWGCGNTIPGWVPKTVGANYDFPDELKPLERMKTKLNVFSGFTVNTDGRENQMHRTGYIGIRTGTAPSGTLLYEHPTIDVLVSDAIGADTRFRSLEMAATGNPSHSYSARSTSMVNLATPTPSGLYARVFGPEFQDPNKADFAPDPRLMARHSVLAAVKEQREALARKVGAGDRVRLDQYFTSIRQLEQQLELQLEKPAPLEACAIPKLGEEKPPGTEIEDVLHNNKLMSGILAHALACNQTKVFNMVFSDWASSIRKQGVPDTHHSTTHNEPMDAERGYQLLVSWYTTKIMGGFADFIGSLDAVKEGDGTLLDHTIVFAHSDTQAARVHGIDGIPMMVAGSGAGRLKTGLHIAGNGDIPTRLGLTLQQAMGLRIADWGTGAMRASQPMSALLA